MATKGTVCLQELLNFLGVSGALCNSLKGSLLEYWKSDCKLLPVCKFVTMKPEMVCKCFFQCSNFGEHCGGHGAPCNSWMVQQPPVSKNSPPHLMTLSWSIASLPLPLPPLRLTPKTFENLWFSDSDQAKESHTLFLICLVFSLNSMLSD